MPMRRLRRGTRSAVLGAFVVLAALTACSGAPPIRSDVNVGGDLSARAGRLILVVLDNSGGALRPEAGSTPHGYDHEGPYTVGDRARATATQLARSYDLTPVREWPIAPLQVDCLVFSLPPHADRTTLLQRLSRDPRVRSAQPLQQFTTLADTALTDAPLTDAALADAASATRAAGAPSGYNDPYLPLQWGFSAMDVAGAQRWSRGRGVSVAVIDTGADIHHPDLAGRTQLARDFIDHDTDAFVADRHGTLVAGIIAAVANNRLGIVGVSPDARLQIYKACEPVAAAALAAECNSFTLALALGTAIDQHAQIVNLSLTGPPDPLLRELVIRGEQRGMIFIGAVPPDGALTGFPLAVPGVVAARASDQGALGPQVLPAPGRDVLSLTPSGHYDFASGASFAAAQISGALAVLRTGSPHASAQQLLLALRRSVEHTATHGEVVNVCVALALVQPLDVCHSSPARRVADQPNRYNR